MARTASVGGERGSSTMSGLSGPPARRGPCPLALLLLFLLGPSLVLAISFHLPINSRKCLREEIHKDLLVTGAYEISDQSGGAGGLRSHLKARGGPGLGFVLASREREGRAVEPAPSARWLPFAGRG
ncbi:Transmembrane emp24 domain-containing protein 10 [Saguinus oedipus]|uniref:Transmembrane emp24 domain-containing protein 10 n=1 Tax=Saguinus oedipus TaxID=9490 RepID=A0ABQ9V531_SAGOE|nr:Transmembrane emp24 domain-containing protein 10 [Saguinus oedipus]